MLIEFAGIPGSGKTYVSKRLREWLAREKIKYVDVDEFIRKNAARNAGSVPALSAGSILSGLGIGDKKLDLGNKSTDVFLRSFISFYRKHHEYVCRYTASLLEWEQDEQAVHSALSAFLYGCARYAYCMNAKRRSDSDVILHEEGFAHRMFTLFGYDRIGREATVDVPAVAVLTPVPQVIFWTRCAPAVAYDRMSGRSGKRFPERMEGLAQTEAIALLEKGERNLTMALDVLEARGAEVVPVLTDGDFSEEEIFNLLRKRLKATR
jgi:thymidylate kinase